MNDLTYQAARLGRVRSALADPAQMRMVFQPIVHVTDNTVVGVEALARFRWGGSPDAWFREAAELGLGPELETLALMRAMSYAHQTPGEYVSVNLSPETILKIDLDEVVAELDVPPNQLIVELTEHAGVTHYEQLLERVACLREIGVRLAVDDAGAGYASLQHILQLRPDLIKLDRSIVAGIDDDAARQHLTSALVDFAKGIGAEVVAEGVETESEMDTLMTEGIRLAQGYLYAAPGPLPLALNFTRQRNAARVLVVDDDATVRRVVTGLLDKSGFVVAGQAADGIQAITQANNIHPDAIVLDLKMPRMSGVKALPELRRIAPEATIIVFSGFTDQKLLTQADAVVDKVEFLSELPLVLSRHMAARRAIA